jgi:uncharacterized protein
LRVETDYPEVGAIVLNVDPERATAFALHLHVPGWCRSFVATSGRESWVGAAGRDLVIERVWSPGDRVEIVVDLTIQVLPGGRSYPHSIALQRGPQEMPLTDPS